MLVEFKELRKKTLDGLKAKLKDLPKEKYVLELGCGHGHFLTALATFEKKSRRAYVGIDKKQQRLTKAQKKSDRAGVAIHWIRGNIEDVLSLWPKRRDVEECFILFPDPWPKKRHWKNRFVNKDSIKKLGGIIKKGGKIYFRTDHKGYFDEVGFLFKDNPAWSIDSPSSWPDFLPQTIFQGYHSKFYSLIAKRN